VFIFVGGKDTFAEDLHTARLRQTASNKNHDFYIMFIFFTCIKKTNQQRSGERKCIRSLGPTMSDCPTQLAKNGRRRKVASGWMLRRVANPFFASLLGCVKRQNKNDFWL